MNKELLITMLLGFVSAINGLSQNTVYAEFSYVKNLGINYVTKGILFANTTKSKFIELGEKNYLDSNRIKQDSTANNFEIVTESRPTNYSFFQTKILISEEYRLGKKYTVKENLPQIQWIFLNESKQIGKYLAKKAEGIFRGRKYIVWYSDEIPIPAGPWKINGLPGLVLSVVDSKKEISFEVNYVKITDDSNLKFQIIDFNNMITLREFVNKQIDNLKQKEKVINSKLPRNHSFYYTPPPRETQMEIIYEWELSDK